MTNMTHDQRNHLYDSLYGSLRVDSDSYTMPSHRCSKSVQSAVPASGVLKEMMPKHVNSHMN